MNTPETNMVILYAVVPESIANDIKLPKGCYATVMHTKEFDTYVNPTRCRVLASKIASSVHALAKRLYPERANSIILRPGE